jgi:hypothetical protein
MPSYFYCPSICNNLTKIYSKADRRVCFIMDIGLYLAYIRLSNIRFTFPVCRIPAARQAATVHHVMASPITKLP